ncbi:MAG: ABC transporter substrate-binding protein [Alphaproteobacteria bacterium]
MPRSIHSSPAFARIGAALALLAALLSCPPARAVELVFNYPIAVGGPIARLVDEMAAEFERENPGIRVRPVHSGSYNETLAKSLTALRAGQGPHLAVLLASDVFSLVDEDAIVPIEDLLRTDDDRAWMQGFIPALMSNSRVGGKAWSVPFQRSTVVLYWNKDAFRQAGLDPEAPPATWDEMVEAARRLVLRDATGRVQRWGVQVPSSAFPYALFQCFAEQAGARLADEDGLRTRLDTPEAIRALQFWVDLSRRHGVHPPGIVDWGTAPADFLLGKVAMTWVTTGNLAHIQANARFPFGVAMLPADLRRGSVPGGGNLYVFRGASPREQEAALRFARFLTAPERAAQWSIDTGYIAVSEAAWRTGRMRAHLAANPSAGVARDQLQHVRAEFSTHDNQRVAKAFTDAIQSTLAGARAPADALAAAQREAERLLRPHRR